MLLLLFLFGIFLKTLLVLLFIMLLFIVLLFVMLLSAEQLLELNADLNTSLVMVTHDMRLARKMDACYELHLGVLKPI